MVKSNVLNAPSVLPEADRLRPPIDLNEALISHVAAIPSGEADKEVSALIGAAKEAREAAESLAELHRTATADLTLSPDAAALRVRRQALGVAERLAKRLDAARTQAAAALDTFERATSAPAAPRDAAAVALEGEIRASLKGMAESERRKAITDAFAGRDMTTIGAVLRGPPYLSGLNQPELDLHRNRYREQFYPAENAAAARKRRALEKFDTLGSSFMRFARRLTDDPVGTRAAGREAAREEAEAKLKEPNHEAE